MTVTCQVGSHLPKPKNSVTLCHVTKSDDERKKKERRRRGKLLREAIEKAELTQREFAERVRTDRSAINQMAAGNRPFGATVAARFTKNLGLPDDYFEPPEAEGESPEGQTVVRRLEALEAALLELVRDGSEFRREVIQRLERLERRSASGGHSSGARTAR